MVKQTTVRVILADDNEIIRAGIRNLLNKAEDIEVVGEAKNGVEAIHLVNTLLPDVLLLDIEMPLLNGIEVTRQLKSGESSTPILVLSAYTNREYIRQMLANGASGYLIKDEAPDQIVAAVRGIARGEKGWVSPQVKAKLGYS
jgi:DNA-binding NarL/FixJ family response regulator